MGSASLSQAVGARGWQLMRAIQALVPTYAGKGVGILVRSGMENRRLSDGGVDWTSRLSRDGAWPMLTSSNHTSLTVRRLHNGRRIDGILVKTFYQGRDETFRSGHLHFCGSLRVTHKLV